MKWLNGDRKKLVVVGIMAMMVFGGGHAKADFTFGEPVNLGPPISTEYNDAGLYIAPDGLEIYLHYYDRSGGYGGWDIWVRTRKTVNDDWGEPVNLGPPVNTGQTEAGAQLLSDGLEMYFTSYNRPGGYGDFDIWVTRRVTKDDPWDQPTNLGSTVNSSAMDGPPAISLDELELYFPSTRPGGYGSEDIWVSRRTTTNDPWGEPENLGPVVNNPASEGQVSLSSDGLILFFSEEINRPIRPGGAGNTDMWMTRRTSISEPWGTPVNLGPIVNSPSRDGIPVISADGSTQYFSSTRPGGFGGGNYGDVYQAPIIPIVDLNSDGIVDADDMCIIVDNWGTDNSLCDIGPMPWGDGTVDVEDLKILTEHLFEDVNDPTLIAHWPLDEAQGVIAFDRVSVCDGILIGDPIWQPEGGMVAGALQFDGIDDCVITDPFLNPADGVFSVIVWINGGAPGQVIISQEGGANWLMTDTEGNLISELISPGRNGSPILSQTNITDGNWHRVGFVWDGSNRTLYVDGVAVAEDTQDGLEGSDNGLYIGCGKNMKPDTFFSGLIDDIRIYNRVVSQ